MRPSPRCVCINVCLPSRSVANFWHACSPKTRVIIWCTRWSSSPFVPRCWCSFPWRSTHCCMHPAIRWSFWTYVKTFVVPIYAFDSYVFHFSSWLAKTHGGAHVSSFQLWSFRQPTYWRLQHSVRSSLCLTPLCWPSCKSGFFRALCSLLIHLSLYVFCRSYAGLMTPIMYYHYLVMRYSSRRNPYPRTAFAELRIVFESLASRSPTAVGKIIRGGIGFVNRLAPQPQPAPTQ